MQVNRSPSFGTDEQLDYDIKSALIEDAVRMLNIKYARRLYAAVQLIIHTCEMLSEIARTILYQYNSHTLPK